MVGGGIFVEVLCSSSFCLLCFFFPTFLPEKFSWIGSGFGMVLFMVVEGSWLVHSGLERMVRGSYHIYLRVHKSLVLCAILSLNGG